MKNNPFQKDKRKDLKERAFLLYKQGLSTRDVGKAIGRSHQWVAVAVKEYLQGVDK